MAPKPRGVRLVRTLTICSVRVPVYRATAQQCSKLTDCFGYWDEERTCVWIRDGQSAAAERDTLLHEACHAFLTLSGLTTTLKMMLGPVRAKRWDETDDDVGLEETLVRQATPHLVAFCKDNKWR
jgi:hypothetical protein